MTAAGQATAHLSDLRRAWGPGPAGLAQVWPAPLRTRFPGKRRLIEAWTGGGAAFARYSTPHGPLFMKYLPAGWRDPRAYRRLAREATFLRDLAPGMPVAHAPLLDLALDRTHSRGHLLTRDLTDETTGWGSLESDRDREAALHDIVRLLARFHAYWAGPGRAALIGRWAWAPETVLTQAQEIAAAAQRTARFTGAVQSAALALPILLQAAPLAVLVHGDIHSGQVLWRPDGEPVLIDYGQVHPSVPGEDLAHLLAVRLNPAERTRLGPALRNTYSWALAEGGVRLSPAELRAQERAGTALNLLSTARQAQHSSGSGIQEALDFVAQAWDELQ